jgi:hypothetical protein
MAVAALHQALTDDLAARLPAWRLVKSRRSFECRRANVTWHLHLAFVNHRDDDFDVVADVAVEHKRGRERVCIVGAELGNIRGTGQCRWAVASVDDVPIATRGILDVLSSTGLPFLERYSSLPEILRVMRSSPNDARLLMPLVADPVSEAASIEARSGAMPNNRWSGP